MKKVSVLTATRAEYGLLKPIITKLNNHNEIDLQIVVTGAHLSPEFGLTYKEIENDGFVITDKVEMLLSSDTPSSITKSMGLTLIGFADHFTRYKPDLLIVLGDRYETLAVCIAAMNERIPIAHLYGGETTEGAIDESIRHAITKLSYLHFTSTEEYRRRVIQLGESPERVFKVGGLGVENILSEPLLLKGELEESMNFSLETKYAIVTFHPVTLENNQSKQQFQALLNACDRFRDIKFIFTKANADADGRVINEMIDEYVRNKENAIAFTSLGMLRFLSAVSNCDFVIGNSSSGLLEVPSFGIPTINIGDRQKGRLKALSVIDCEPDETEIYYAMSKALSPEFREIAKMAVNPYGDGKTSNKLIKVILDFLKEDKVNLKKKFYDLEEKS